jgi:plastocyanin
MRTAMLFFAASFVTLWIIGSEAGTAPRPTTHTVTIEGIQFRPQTLTVAAGDTIVWVNKDLVAHTATSATAGIFDSKLIAPANHGRLRSARKGTSAMFARTTRR